ncbi:hypothetical protein os1_22480 [Comamonadaceae bacterium OS-1]|nr:hypothetical protein os1_22480 [Comamonadaceae bacterium OS-1]
MYNKTPLIYDCFTYNGEDDLLWLRLETLKNVVDKVIIAEATRTFTGKEKKLRFDASKFGDFSKKIEYIIVNDLNPNPASPWDNENHQRNALARFISLQTSNPLKDDDWIILSDVDEIPRPDSIKKFDPNRYKSGLLEQRNYFYAFNNQAQSDGINDEWWRKVRVTTFKQFNEWFGSMQSLRDFRTTGPMRGFKRYWNKLKTQNLSDAGWHFSYLMTPEEIIEKLAAFSHQEVNIPDIANIEYLRKCISERKVFFGNGKCNVVPLDYSFPEPLRNNLDRFNNFIW